MKRLIALILTVIILAILIASVDVRALGATLRATDPLLFSLGMLTFIPQVWIISARWRRLVLPFAPISMFESVSLILASQTMNLVLPSKMGDLTKSVFLHRTGALDLPRALAVVVIEKMLDLGMLAAIMLVGVAFLAVRHQLPPAQAAAAAVAALIGAAAVVVVALVYFVPPNKLPGVRRGLDWLGRRPRMGKVAALLATSRDVVALLQSRGARRSIILAMTVAIWVCHMIQIWLFFASTGVRAPLAQFASMVPLGIFVGLLPITIGGFGTRDAAFVYLFAQFPRAAVLAGSLYVNLRYILPSIAGIPFLNRYIVYSRKQ